MRSETLWSTIEDIVCRLFWTSIYHLYPHFCTFNLLTQWNIHHSILQLEVIQYFKTNRMELKVSNEITIKWCKECSHFMAYTVYPKKYAHGFVVLCFVVVMQSFIMNSHEVFIHIHQGCFAGTGAIVRLPQCQWSKPGGYGKISQCIATTKHSKAKTVCIFLGIYCICQWNLRPQ